jgi:FeS assembly SUF system protein
MLLTEVIKKLRTIYDPEIPVDIYSLGLVYNVEVNRNNDVNITMTLTTATSPAAAYLPEEVENVVKEIPEVENVHVNVVWSPKWETEMMSKEAKSVLGFFS